MITLSNNHKIDFLCSAGALGFDGKGYWWEKPLIWLKYIKPEDFTIITKTLTLHPRKGNYNKWLPLKSFRLIKNGIVNAMGLPNPGLLNWIKSSYKIPKEYKLIVSINPNNVYEAKLMAELLKNCPENIIALEYNASCPNYENYNKIYEITLALKKQKLPVIIKLSWENCKEISKLLDGQVEAFDIINSVKWNNVFPNKISPLKSLGGGGISGSIIKKFAREAIAKLITCKTPIISGGGIDSVEEVYCRHVMGARAYSIGTLFTIKPWMPNLIIDECREVMNYKKVSKI